MRDEAAADFSDDKDWTWVLERPCPECSFDASDFAGGDVAAMIRAAADEWHEILSAEPDQLRRRPRPDRWSPLEYGYHVRDVFELYDQRLALMLDQDSPHYPNWDQDLTARTKEYRSADPERVGAELQHWAGRLADRFDAVAGDQWARTGYRSDGAEFTVESFAKYLIHDPLHHLWDVRHGAP